MNRSDGLRSWGLYPHHPQQGHGVYWRDELPCRLERLVGERNTTLAFGAGRSYGDSCLAASDHVLHLRPLDRLITFDAVQGVICAEAGASLAEVLAVTIPKGWFLPVVPGTSHATLGGAVANDVHGKNHHRRGTFGRHVRRFGLLRSDQGRLVCSEDENPELFRSTIGGLGLTGVIEWVEVQLVRIGSTRMRVLTQRFDRLDDFFSLSDELDERHEFCVSWIDCVSQGHRAGRGVYMAGDFEADGGLDRPVRTRRTVPFTPPFPLINPVSLRVFNELYWRRAPAGRHVGPQPADAFFFPLDAIDRWNRVYGPRGFQQYQALIPTAHARDGIRALLSAIAASGTGSFLAVLKRCASIPSPGHLSFPAEGTTLALDFAQNPSLTSDLFPRLDAIVRATGGRLYPAKDAHMSGEDFRRAYPAWTKVEAVRDPALMSRFWQRVIS